MKKHYKIAIVGFGSIGKRHLGNIVDVLQNRGSSFSIDLIRRDTSKDVNDDVKHLIDNIYYSFEEVPDDYEIIFVTNPTYLHFQTIKKLVPKTKHMFIEKPVFDDTSLPLEELKLRDNGIYYVACPLRYTDVIEYVRNHIELRKVYSARAICSSYLPEWRSGVDYRKTYSAHLKEGGGVSMDLIHEWDYIHYLFGIPEDVYNLRGKFSNMEVDSDDLSLYIARYKTMMVELHLDYFGRKTIRELQLFTEEDTIIADIANSEVRYMKTGDVISFKESRNDFQCKEIQCFFDVLEGKITNPNNIDMAVRTLKIAKAGKL